MKKMILPCLLLLLCGACATNSGAKVDPMPMDAKDCMQAKGDMQATKIGPVLPASILEEAQKAAGITQIRVYFGEQGQARKLAVYHGDASRIPAPVKALVQKNYPEARIQEYETEYYASVGEVYEVELQSPDGTSMEVSVFADGRMHYVETEMKPEALPEAQRKVAMDAVPGGTIVEVESKVGPEVNLLQVKVAPAEGLGNHYLVFDKDGELLRHTVRYPALIEVPVAP